MTTDYLSRFLLILIPLWISLSLHEWAHAYSAHLLGDDTARLQGRMTLNPLAHIDPVGTLLLPLLGVPFGWAKPVPINPLAFRRNVNMKTGLLISAAAGPVSNIITAIICAIVIGALTRSGQAASLDPVVFAFLGMLMRINVVLAVFNALPVPPLDGSRVADALVPRRLQKQWDGFRRLSPILLLIVLVGPGMLGFSIIGGPVQFVLDLLGRVFISPIQ